MRDNIHHVRLFSIEAYVIGLILLASVLGISGIVGHIHFFGNSFHLATLVVLISMSIPGMVMILALIAGFAAEKRYAK